VKVLVKYLDRNSARGSNTVDRAVLSGILTVSASSSDLACLAL
jgi:hypothetical protein